jgi:hypothetical protein
VGKPEEFVFELRNNMEEFLEDFWKEYKRQSKIRNKSSEKRMRILLSSFKERVHEPYKKSSLDKESTGLENILGEKSVKFKNTS